MNSIKVFTFLCLSGTFSFAQVIPEPRQVIPEPRQVIPEPRQGQIRQYYTIDENELLYQSTNYKFGQAYNLNDYFAFHVSSPIGTRIEIDCRDVHIESSRECKKDALVVSVTGSKDFADGKGVCGRGSFVKTSIGNSMTVKFYSGRRRIGNDNYRFSCIIRKVTEPQQVTTPAPVPTTTTTQATTTETTTKLPTTTTTTTKQPTTTKTTTNPPSAPVSYSSCNCGVRRESKRIVGGTEAEMNEFPWRCVLHSPTLGTFCGATVLSNRWILTAAHCTDHLNDAQKNDLGVSCGDHNLTTTTETRHQYIKVDNGNIKQHPQYNKTFQMDHDVSLLRLTRDLTFSDTIMPICLPLQRQGNDCEKSGTVVTASGWGTTQHKGTGSRVLLKVDLNCMSTSQCQQYYPKSINNNMICTLKPGQDTCQGDSGGSIDYKDPATGRFFAIGVVSWGVGCAEPRNPGVYAKVTNYIDWIRSTTQENYCSP